ncbi:MAG: hypothetical protein OXC63_12510 [Aestuariivita sp.]|nr:hypothetical protein [Aestuariivita sp.]MCY4346627.1 hypothetical protein [Aestuariivita sp.]
MWCFIVPDVFDGLNEQAALIVCAIIETDYRPSELANILPENIILDDELPLIRIKATDMHQRKTVSSVRDIPLGGARSDETRTEWPSALFGTKAICCTGL